MLQHCEIFVLGFTTLSQHYYFVEASNFFGLLKRDQHSFENGLDPAEYFRLKKRKRRLRRPSGLAAAAGSSGSFSKRPPPAKRPIPKAEFLIPETYETPPPECSGGDGTLSGMTFINFLISAIAVAANVVSNINSNQRNNNNNNNDNNGEQIV